MVSLRVRKVARVANPGRARRLLVDTGWIYGSQIVTVLLQLAYTAVTSRAVSPSAFGEYAIAILVGGFVLLIANGGLGTAVARMGNLDESRLRVLWWLSIGFGLLSAAILIVSAPLWAGLWGAANAVGTIRSLALVALTSPMVAMATGLVRRGGRYRYLALATLGSNLLGMVVGVIVVLILHNSVALIVYSSIAQLGLLLTLYPWIRPIAAWPGRNWTARDVGFSFRLTLLSLMQYLTLNAGPWGIARFLSPANLGQWNRADALSTVPFYQLQAAVVQVLGPEFRHDVANNARAYRVWSDMLILAAWFALPAAAFGFAVVPDIVLVLLGERWAPAASLAAILCIAGGLRLLDGVLASGLESLDRFRTIWAIQGALLILQALVVFSVWTTGEAVWAAIGLIATTVVRHLASVMLAHRWGYLNLKRVMSAYASSAVVAFVVGLSVYLLARSPNLLDSGIGIVSLATTVGTLFLLRKRLEIFSLLRHYARARSSHSESI